MESVKTIQRYWIDFTVTSNDNDGNIRHDRLRTENIIQIQLLLHHNLPMHGNLTLLHLILVVLIWIMDDKKTLG